MIPTLLRKIRQVFRRLWARVLLITGMALLAAVLSPLSKLLPLGLSDKIGEEEVSQLLSILTSSMLAVTTFSLSIMVSAHLAAGANATPRAHRLLQEDHRTQTVIATFIGAFVFALTLTVMINARLIGGDGMAFIYFMTVGVIVLVVIAIIRWVAHLSGLGSVEATIRRVEERARTSLDYRIKHPFLGARAPVALPRKADLLLSPRFGYIAEIDVADLSSSVANRGGILHLVVKPGDWVDEGATLAHVTVPLDEAFANTLHAAIAISDRRDFEQDATFALMVLSEIGERALSPGINDPRTAQDIIGRLTRLIASIPREGELDEPTAPAVHVAGIDFDDLMRESLDPIARDGAGFVQIQMAVQNAYRTLSTHRDPGAATAARLLSARALAYAQDGVLLKDDLDRLARLAPADAPARRSGEGEAGAELD